MTHQGQRKRGLGADNWMIVLQVQHLTCMASRVLERVWKKIVCSVYQDLSHTAMPTWRLDTLNEWWDHLCCHRHQKVPPCQTSQQGSPMWIAWQFRGDCCLNSKGGGWLEGADKNTSSFTPDAESLSSTESAPVAPDQLGFSLGNTKSLVVRAGAKSPPEGSERHKSKQEQRRNDARQTRKSRSTCLQFILWTAPKTTFKMLSHAFSASCIIIVLAMTSWSCIQVGARMFWTMQTCHVFWASISNPIHKAAQESSCSWVLTGPMRVMDMTTLTGRMRMSQTALMQTTSLSLVESCLFLLSSSCNNNSKGTHVPSTTTEEVGVCTCAAQGSGIPAKCNVVLKKQSMLVSPSIHKPSACIQTTVKKWNIRNNQQRHQKANER